MKKDSIKRTLLDYYNTPNKEITIEHLHELKEFFYSIIDELAVIKVELKRSSFSEISTAIDYLTGYFMKAGVVNFPHEYSREKYWKMLANFGLCSQLSMKLWEELETLKYTDRLKAFNEIQTKIENSLSCVIELIEELSPKNK
jgi:hypothetical protein